MMESNRLFRHLPVVAAAVATGLIPFFTSPALADDGPAGSDPETRADVPRHEPPITKPAAAKQTTTVAQPTGQQKISTTITSQPVPQKPTPDTSPPTRNPQVTHPSPRTPLEKPSETDNRPSQTGNPQVPRTQQPAPKPNDLFTPDKPDSSQHDGSAAPTPPPTSPDNSTGTPSAPSDTQPLDPDGQSYPTPNQRLNDPKPEPRKPDTPSDNTDIGRAEAPDGTATPAPPSQPDEIAGQADKPVGQGQCECKPGEAPASPPDSNTPKPNTQSPPPEPDEDADKPEQPAQGNQVEPRTDTPSELPTETLPPQAQAPIPPTAVPNPPSVHSRPEHKPPVTLPPPSRPHKPSSPPNTHAQVVVAPRPKPPTTAAPTVSPSNSHVPLPLVSEEVPAPVPSSTEPSVLAANPPLPERTTSPSPTLTRHPALLSLVVSHPVTMQPPQLPSGHPSPMPGAPNPGSPTGQALGAHTHIAKSRAQPVTPERISNWIHAVQQDLTRKHAGQPEVHTVWTTTVEPAPQLGSAWIIQRGDTAWSIARALWGENVSWAVMESTWITLVAWNPELHNALPHHLPEGVSIIIPADIPTPVPA